MNDLHSSLGLLSLSFLPACTPKSIHQLISLYATRTQALNDSFTLGFDRPSEKIYLALKDQIQWKRAVSRAQEILQICTHNQIRVCSYFDPHYPNDFHRLTSPPILLYIKGTWPPPYPQVTLIGTRYPHAWNLEVTRRLTQVAVQQGWGITSGLALGIDACAHQSTLQIQGYTLAVLGHGLNHIYPSHHQSLAHEILNQGGTLISEYPPNTPVRSYQLVARDRLQSRLGKLTVLTQSALDGGSMHTVRFAVLQKKPLYVPQLPRFLSSFNEQQGNFLLGRKSASEILTKSPQLLDLKSHLSSSQLSQPLAHTLTHRNHWIECLLDVD